MTILVVKVLSDLLIWDPRICAYESIRLTDVTENPLNILVENCFLQLHRDPEQLISIGWRQRFGRRCGRSQSREKEYQCRKEERRLGAINERPFTVMLPNVAFSGAPSLRVRWKARLCGYLILSTSPKRLKSYFVPACSRCPKYTPRPSFKSPRFWVPTSKAR